MKRGKIFWIIHEYSYDWNGVGFLTMAWGVVGLCKLDLTVPPWGLLAPKVVPLPWRDLLRGENWGEMRHTGRPGEKTAPSFPTNSCRLSTMFQKRTKKWGSSPWKRLNLLDSDNVELALCTCKWVQKILLFQMLSENKENFWRRISHLCSAEAPFPFCPKVSFNIICHLQSILSFCFH